MEDVCSSIIRYLLIFFFLLKARMQIEMRFIVDYFYEDHDRNGNRLYNIFFLYIRFSLKNITR